MPALRVLILGGYGLFGERLARRLARWPELELWLAGRRLSAAQQMCQALHAQAATAARLHAVALDLNAPDLAARLAALQLDAVVHTAGPFQAQDYRVARACIQAGCHCIDLADGRDFVTGIGQLDAEARACGVAIVSGASSVPALSAAAADALAVGMERVALIDIGISPGNQAPRGAATVRAVLSYCGEPIASRDGAPDTVGWLPSWTHRFAEPVGERLLSPCDVPDLDLLGAHFPGEPRVRFGAGLELRWMHRGMQLMARARQRGWAPNWRWAAGPLRAIAQLFQGAGSDHGGMVVRVQGWAQGVPVSRQWELVARDGDGPYVPTLAAAALLRRLTRPGGAQPRGLPPGAQACVGLLSLDDFARERQGLRIDWAQAGAEPSLFHRVLGEAFEQLHPAVQRFHSLQGQHELSGQVEVLAPAGALARLAARLLGAAPRAARGPFAFRLEAQGSQETWLRRFQGRDMRSTLRWNQGLIEERLGLARLRLGLSTDAKDGRLRMHLCGFAVLGLPMPRILWPRVTAEERGETLQDPAGVRWRLHFHIDSSLPLIGRVAAYRGWLELP